MGTTATDPLIFPLGHYAGERYDCETEASTYDLRSGWRVTHLTPEERDVWALAHGLTNRLGRGIRWTRAALLAAAGPANKEEFSSTIETMLEKDLLAEVSPGSEQAVEFAQRVQLVPLQLGLGNSAEKPWIWRIGSPATTVEVSETVYHIWEWCHLYRNLWDACQALARDNAKDYEDPTQAEDCDPAAILTDVLDTTHALLSATCVYLEGSFDWGTV
ncbi:MAG: hypothetical protein JXA67_13840 [Micromonosporaceae bacterium]|nr:hypothetical protein [Micromonosporaceae bacterium]